MAAARTCFERWGVDRTRMEDIAAEAGIPRPALYRHFSSKDDLVREVMVRHIRGRAHRLESSVPLQGPAGPIILQVLLSGLEDPGDHVSESVLGFGVVHTTARLVATSDPIAEAMSEYWWPFLRYAADRGQLRPGIDVEHAVRWLTLVVFYLLAIPEVAPSREELADYLDAFVVGAIIS